MITPAHEQPGCQLYHGDCRAVLPQLVDRPRLIFADPPFNIGDDYRGFKDQLPWDQYEAFAQDWIRAAEQVLAENSILAVHVPDQLVKLVLNTVTLERIGWVVWHYRFGECQRAE